MSAPPRERALVSDEALRLDAVARRYKEGGRSVDVLTGADLLLRRGEIAALVGPSGSGKSTLLHLAGLLEKPDGGEVSVSGVAAGRLRDGDRTRIRRSQIGFVYQFHHLLPDFDAEENVAMPLLLQGAAGRRARAKAGELLDRMGLAARRRHRPAQLSGGERQRTAIARALAHEPALVLADEPTGALDPETAARVFAVFESSIQDAGAAALVATHNLDLAASLPKTFALEDKRIVARPGGVR